MLFCDLAPRRRDRRNLASAFVGEIVAAMEAVADHSEVKRLHHVASTATEPPFDFSDFKLPRLAVYGANIAKLCLFSAPLPRELSYFCSGLDDLPQRLRALKPSPTSSADDLQSRAQSAIGEIAETMTLGENLLRSVKGFVSRKQPHSITRA